jgi:hypothetical protein
MSVRKYEIGPGLTPELLERRCLCSAAAGSLVLPRVWDVWASSSQWTPEFRQQIAIDYGGADARYGWPLAGGFTWVNVDRVTVRFSRPVEVAPDDLVLHGVNSPRTTPVSVEYEYDARLGLAIATWALDRPIWADKFILEVDADPGGVHARDFEDIWLDGDNDSEPGGDFLRRFNVIPANTSAGAYVGADDFAWVRQALNTSIARRGVGNGSYTMTRDLNGDGRINSVDLSEVRKRYLSRLPFGEPTVSAAGAGASASRLRPVTRSLFNSEPILA